MGVVREGRGLVRHVASPTEAVGEDYIMGGASSQGAGLPPGAALGADELRAREGRFQALPSSDLTGRLAQPRRRPPGSPGHCSPRVLPRPGLPAGTAPMS